MRPAPWLIIEPYRIAGEYGMDAGAFHMERSMQLPLRIIASSGMGWEHVSVSTTKRCPTWEEMCHVKDLFWLPEEAVMQLHPPASQYVNHHPYCLHLWRPLEGAILLPPSILVGPKGGAT